MDAVRKELKSVFSVTEDYQWLASKQTAHYFKKYGHLYDDRGYFYYMHKCPHGFVKKIWWVPKWNRQNSDPIIQWCTSTCPVRGRNLTKYKWE
jgi:hypothetical protein